MVPWVSPEVSAVQVAVLSSVSGCAGEVFRLLADNAEFRAAPHGRTFMTTLAEQAGASGRSDDLTAITFEQFLTARVPR